MLDNLSLNYILKQKAILWGAVHPAVFGKWIPGLFSSCLPEASEAEKGPHAAAQL